MKHQPRQHASLRREYSTPSEQRPRIKEVRSTTVRKRTTDPTIRSLQPLIFYADASDIDVSAVHVFADPNEDGICYGFVTACGTVNLILPRKLARQLIDATAKQLEPSRC